MINKKLLFSVKESIPYIKKNVMYQWIGLICNVCSTACLCLIITKQDNYFLYIGMILVCLIIRYIVNQKAIEMSYSSSHIVKETLRTQLYKKLSKIGIGYTNKWSTAEIAQIKHHILKIVLVLRLPLIFLNPKEYFVLIHHE